MSEQLQKHKNLVAIIEQNLAAQAKILKYVTDHYVGKGLSPIYTTSWPKLQKFVIFVQMSNCS